ncbi:hypothetical protein L873DRAFT_1577906, partial [Choiromyces venosus 120613-1]
QLDASDFRARTLLFFAVLNGHKGVVSLLLSRYGVSPNSLDNSWEMPLSVVNLLLGRKDIILNRLGTVGSSAIYLATWYGRKEILRVLLAWED